MVKKPKGSGKPPAEIAREVEPKKTSLPNPSMSIKEIALMKKILKEHSKSFNVAVELGSFEGGTSILISKALKKGATLHLVEIFAVNGSDVRPRFLNNVLPKFKNMKLIEVPTHDAAPLFTEPIDFLFIDADHQDHSIQEDCKDWLPKVVPGGIVAFHDYKNPSFPSIEKRVDEETVGWETLDNADTLEIKVKPKSD